MIRSAQSPDAAAIAAIYNQGIADRGVTLGTTPGTVAGLEARLADVGQYPVPLAEDGEAPRRRSAAVVGAG